MSVPQISSTSCPSARRASIVAISHPAAPRLGSRGVLAANKNRIGPVLSSDCIGAIATLALMRHEQRRTNEVQAMQPELRQHSQCGESVRQASSEIDTRRFGEITDGDRN